MDELRDEVAWEPPNGRREWSVILSLAIAITILLVTFVWLVLQIDPFLSDFVSRDQPSPTVAPTPLFQ